MFLHLGYYVTESSGHNSEYNCVVPQAPGPDREVLHARHRLEPRRLRLHPRRVPASRENDWKDDIQKWLDDPKPLNLERGHEYAA